MDLRGWFARFPLEPLLFGGALLLGAVAVPLGLGGPESSLAVARARDFEDLAPAPLALLVTHLFGYMPVGDFAARANFAAALAAALAAAWLGRLTQEALRWLRSEAIEPRVRGRAPSDGWFEPLAAFGGAAVVVLSLDLFHASTRAGPLAATVALTAGAWILALRLLRSPGDARAGLGLALLAGLSAGVDPGAAALLWPPTAALWLWGLRRGERWPLLALMAAAVGLGVALATLAVSVVPGGLWELATGLWPHRSGGGQAALWEVGEQIGVVGLLLAATGFFVLAARAPKIFALLLWALAAGFWFSGPTLTLATAALAVPVGVGITHLAQKLGRARVPAAATLAVLAVVWPALDGSPSRWSPDDRLFWRLLDQALLERPPRSRVHPGTPEMESLFRYARATGLRPDLSFAPVSRR